MRQVHPRDHPRPVRQPDLHARRRLRLVHLEPRPELLRAPLRTPAPAWGSPTPTSRRERAGDGRGLRRGWERGGGGGGGAEAVALARERLGLARAWRRDVPLCEALHDAQLDRLPGGDVQDVWGCTAVYAKGR